jgi:hypothetical protein
LSVSSLASSKDLAFAMADEHGAGSGASTSKFAGSLHSTWGFDIRGRQTPASRKLFLASHLANVMETLQTRV